MIVDCHVHIAACTPGHGSLSPRLLHCLPFEYMQWKFGLRGANLQTELRLEQVLVQTVDQTPQLDAVVVLAFDGVFRRDGRFDPAQTHLYITNDYVMKLCRRYPKVLFGASVHPYRKDAIAEVERCAKAGAVLMKWLPIVQNFNPADDRCIPFYEALAHYRLPLLSHTGGEHLLPNLDSSVADPMLLLPAIKRGVTVIMAHCGTRLSPLETNYMESFARLAREYEHCYGDTAALNLPMRSYAYDLLRDPVVSRKLVHGSDWPVIPIPPIARIGLRASVSALSDSNWMRRDIMIKQKLGFDQAYWHRAAEVLSLVRVGEQIIAQR